MITIKRVYDEPSPTDGYRILVDRLWPRGVSKDRAGIDLWLKTVAPSPDLRIWFAHDPAKFDRFRHRYEAELAHNDAYQTLLRLTKEYHHVSLVYAAKDPAINHAVVLAELLSRQN